MMNTPESPRRTIQWLIVPLAIFLVGIVLNANTLDGEFLFSWDDNRYIAENDLIKDFSPDGIWALFHGNDKFGLQFYFAGYIPVTLLTYSVDYAVWGYEATGFHATNIIFQALNGVLVYFVVRRLQGMRAVGVIAALLFLVHPLQVESVAWIAQRKSVVSMFFFLLGMLTHMRASEERASFGWLGLAWLLYLLATLAKPSAAGAVVIFSVYDYFWSRIKWWHIPLRNLPYAVIGAWGAYVVREAHIAINGLASPASENRFEVAKLMAWVMWDYTTSLFAPFDLNALYLYPLRDINSGGVRIVLGAGIILGSLLLAGVLLLDRLRNQRSGRPLVLFTIVWVWMFMLPVSNIVPLSIQRADRYMYFPSIMLFTLVGVGFVRLWEWRPRVEERYALIAGLALVIGLFAALTIERNDVWTNSRTLWGDHLDENPGSLTGDLNYGLYFINTGDDATAIPIFDRLVSNFPDNYKANFYRGQIAERAHDWPLVVRYFGRARSIDPDEAQLEDNLARAYFELAVEAAQDQNYALVEDYLTQGLQFDLAALDAEPYLASARLRIAGAAAQHGDYVTSDAFLTSAASMNLADMGLLDDLGITTFEIGLAAFNNDDFSRALDYYNRALETVPEDQLHVVYNNIGFTHYNLNDYSAAIQNYTLALELNPAYVLAMTNLGNAEAAAGNNAAAEAAYQRALDIEPENEAALRGMEQLP